MVTIDGGRHQVSSSRTGTSTDDKTNMVYARFVCALSPPLGLPTWPRPPSCAHHIMCTQLDTAMLYPCAPRPSKIAMPARKRRNNHSVYLFRAFCVYVGCRRGLGSKFLPET